MAEKERTLVLGNRKIPVMEVDVLNRSDEVMAEYQLSDGSVIRVFNPVAVVYRMTESDMKDSDGNPLYLVKLGTSVITVESLRLNPTSGPDGKAS